MTLYFLMLLNANNYSKFFNAELGEVLRLVDLLLFS